MEQLLKYYRYCIAEALLDLPINTTRIHRWGKLLLVMWAEALRVDHTLITTATLELSSLSTNHTHGRIEDIYVLRASRCENTIRRGNHCSCPCCSRSSGYRTACSPGNHWRRLPLNAFPEHTVSLCAWILHKLASRTEDIVKQQIATIPTVGGER
jgi:hypothetical protein